MEYTSEELQAAYAKVAAAEKDMLIATDAVVTTFLADVKAITAKIPSDAPISPMISLLKQLESHITALSLYQLDGLRMQYGLTSASGDSNGSGGSTGNTTP